MKWENEFISSDDQIIIFTNENCQMSNNIFNNSAKIIKNNQGNFGCMFPLSLNQDGTIFSSLFGLGIRQNKISINFILGRLYCFHKYQFNFERDNTLSKSR